MPFAILFLTPFLHWNFDATSVPVGEQKKAAKIVF